MKIHLIAEHLCCSGSSPMNGWMWCLISVFHLGLNHTPIWHHWLLEVMPFLGPPYVVEVCILSLWASSAVCLWSFHCVAATTKAVSPVCNHPHSSLPRRAVWGSTLASVSAAFSSVYWLAFETGTLHIGGFGHCQITLLPLQAPETGAITSGESGEFKRTLYWEEHNIETGTVPEKAANTGVPVIFFRLYNAWVSKSSRGIPFESLGSLYVRDQPDMDVKCKGLDTKATAASTEPMHSLKVRLERRNKGRNSSFCCQSGLQSRQPSHSLAELVTESLLLDSCLTCLFPQYFPIFLVVKKGRLVLALHMWQDFQLLPGAVGTWLRKLILFF